MNRTADDAKSTYSKSNESQSVSSRGSATTNGRAINQKGSIISSSTKVAAIPSASNGSGKGDGSSSSSIPCSGNSQSALWGGIWVPPCVTNSLRSNYWLPNDVFASSHIALGVELTTDDSLLHTQWDV